MHLKAAKAVESLRESPKEVQRHFLREPLTPVTKKRFLLLAETFQALGDFTRVQIIWHLSRQEHSVGDISRLLTMSQPAVSHHLRTLRNLQLVKIRRVGRTSYYSLDDNHITRLLEEGMKHVEELL